MEGLTTTADFRFPAEDHLRRSEDFARLRREGRVTRHPALTISCAPNMLAHNRYGIIVSKPLGNAVIRNRTRRLLREAIRLRRPDFTLGYDVAFIPRRELIGQPFAEVERIVHEVCVRAGLLRM